MKASPQMFRAASSVSEPFDDGWKVLRGGIVIGIFLLGQGCGTF